MKVKLEKQQKLVIPLGETWKGFEFITIQRYKRKDGFKITCVRRYWSGKYRTIATERARDRKEVVKKIKKLLLPIFDLPESVIEEIYNFCEIAKKNKF